MTLSYKGRSETAVVPSGALLEALFEEACRLFDLPEERYDVKLILKGKKLERHAPAAEALASKGSGGGGGGVKLMVMASTREAVAAVKGAVSDPKVASFAAEHGSRKAGIPTSKGARQGKMR